MRGGGGIAALLAVAALAALPAVLSSYAITVFIFIFFYAYLGQAWNIVGGYAGQLSAGHAAFVGVGAYTSAILSMKLGLTPWIGMFMGGLLSAALGAVIGFLGLAAIAYFGVSVVAVGTVLVLGAVGLALWSVGWVLAEAVLYAVRLIARLTDGAAIVIQRVIDVLMTPGKAVWNWLASFDRARALRLQPIAQPEPRVIRMAPGEGDVLEEAAVR